MATKKVDPYPVTIADIHRQMKNAQAGNPNGKLGTLPDEKGRILIRPAKASGTHMIQHT